MENAQNGQKSYNFQFWVKIGLKILKMGPYELMGQIRLPICHLNKKNIDISVKNMSKPSEMIIWPNLLINSKSTEMNGLIGHFWIYVVD